MNSQLGRSLRGEALTLANRRGQFSQPSTGSLDGPQVISWLSGDAALPGKVLPHVPPVKSHRLADLFIGHFSFSHPRFDGTRAHVHALCHFRFGYVFVNCLVHRGAGSPGARPR